MIRSMSFPLSRPCVEPFGTWETLAEELKKMGLDGIEAIADPDSPVDGFPPSLLAGWHMTFYPDWVDFYREDTKALTRKFGSVGAARGFYRCGGPEDFVRLFRDDLALAVRLGTPYVVFHVSDVSIEEGYTYRWEHTDREVIDASLGIINEILAGIAPTFDFLVENQWWPGFTFTEPEKTEYLLSRIGWPRAGIMLDTGHLMNTNTAIRTQKDGVRHILSMLEKHGELSRSVRGLHFHQSLSGAYVRRTVGRMPEDFPQDPYEAFARSYAHILQIDRHRPWTDGDCVCILEAVRPAYLTHELSGGGRARLAAVKRQLSAIRRGAEALGYKSI